jgi:cysteine desulfurase
MDQIYLDYAATTPLDKDVFEKMKPYLFEDFGNPSSSHFFGQKAETAVDCARRTMAELLDASGEEILFTGSGSEGDNLAIKGAAFERRKKTKANKILISPLEHSAVTETAFQLQNEFGFEVTLLRVDKFGIIDLEFLREVIDENVTIVSTVYANNEIGSINPIHEIAVICHEKGIPFHTDGVQACAHLDVRFHMEEIDLLALAAHKFYGPKGVGALIHRKGIEMLPQITGGKQENKLRAGTHNVPGIVGMAAALEKKTHNLVQNNEMIIKKRDRIIHSICSTIQDSYLTGHPLKRLPNHASFVFEGIVGNDLVVALDMAGFACSSGSACKVGDPKPSKILLGMGLSPDLALGSLRITLGNQTTDEHIDRFLDVLPGLVKKLRK